MYTSTSIDTDFNYCFLEAASSNDISGDSEVPGIGDTWQEGMPTHVNGDGTTFVVSKRTGKYVDILDKSLKREFDAAYHTNPKNRFMNPCGDDSFGVRIVSFFGGLCSPIIGLDWSWKDAGWLSILRPDQNINNAINGSNDYTNNYKMNLQIKRINYYSEYNIIY